MTLTVSLCAAATQATAGVAGTQTQTIEAITTKKAMMVQWTHQVKQKTQYVKQKTQYVTYYVSSLLQPTPCVGDPDCFRMCCCNTGDSRSNRDLDNRGNNNKEGNNEVENHSAMDETGEAKKLSLLLFSCSNKMPTLQKRRLLLLHQAIEGP